MTLADQRRNSAPTLLRALMLEDDEGPIRPVRRCPGRRRSLRFKTVARELERSAVFSNGSYDFFWDTGGDYRFDLERGFNV